MSQGKIGLIAINDCLDSKIKEGTVHYFVTTLLARRDQSDSVTTTREGSSGSALTWKPRFLHMSSIAVFS